MRKEPYTIHEVNEIFGSYGYSLLTTEYKNVNTKLSVEDKDGYKYSLTLGAFKLSLKNNQLPYKFSTRNLFSTENIIKWIEESDKDYVYVSGIFKTAIIKNIKLKCLQCGNKWFTSWNYIQTGRGCNSEKCKSANSSTIGKLKNLSEKNNLLYCYPDSAIEWDYSKNDFNPEDVCPKSDSRAYWICPSCKNSYSSQVKNWSYGYRCPFCNSSKGEKKILEYLLENNIDFISQKRFEDCINKKTLPFDFYIPSSNIVIEYNGEQHYSIPRGNWFNGEEGFLYRQKNDSMKRKYCDEKGIFLLEISYLDFKNINKILDSNI